MLYSRTLLNGLYDKFGFCCGRQKRFVSSSKKHKSVTHYYDVLGITKQASPQQIKSSYYKLSKKYHPDVNTSPGADKIFHEISEAYEVLGKASSRREYDKRFSRSPSSRMDGNPNSFHSREGFKPRSTTPPTGRTPIYDFDEFYKMHYGELRARRQEDIKKTAHAKRMKEKREMAKSEEMVTSTVLAVIVAVVLIFSLSKRH